MDRRRALACACLPEPDLADWLRLGLGIVISGQLMLLSLALNLSTIQPAIRGRIELAVLGLTVLGVVLLGPELVLGLQQAWRRREASLEAMFGLAFLGGLGASALGLVTGGPVFFEVITVVLCVHALGQRLKARFWATAMDRVEASGLLPREANRLDGDALRRIQVDALRTGDRVVVYDGERAPASGRVVEGSAWLQTDDVDGARVPRWIGPGDDVPGGAAVRGGTLRMQVDDLGTDELGHTREALVRAYASDPASGLATQLARLFVPVVVSAAAVAGLAWSAWSGPRDGFMVATAVLLVACPCGFGLATPVATWAAASRLASYGVHVRRPAALEALAGVQLVVLDKTGTLTELVPRLRTTEGAVTRWVGAVQQWFDHPIARLLWRGGADSPTVRNPAPLPAGGVAAEVFDQGAWRTLQIVPIEMRRDLGVWVDGELTEVVGVDEQLTSGVSDVVRALAELGVQARILTGDRVDPRLGVPFEGGASPSEKARRVRELRQAGLVAFVGDRPNDLAAMAEADVAIAVPGASPLIVENADLRVDALARLPGAVRSARSLRARLRRLLLLSLGGNAAGISAAVFGLLHPVAAALIMALSSLAVTLLAVPREP
ncbi:MAG: HAD-IC family P-type ATPase [Alphaproteobacteria bacterium]|nr:HAD-IC family P-type ATPase [Alphaproteobacteria bacterium]MCB9686062.1 HAD-IC family P-type ATPase [Alphaproteobacteria bacterium]